jgi:hypothetical protein
LDREASAIGGSDGSRIAAWTAAFAMAVALLACAPSAPATPALAASAPPPPSAAPGTLLVVHLGGSINCGQFPYGCYAALSVTPAGTKVEEHWRPLATDPLWIPDGPSTEAFDPSPVGAIPALTPGGHRLVISLLGSYDTPSFTPDGSRATDLLSRCMLDVEVDPAARPIEIQVTFTPDGVSFGGSCSIEAMG